MFPPPICAFCGCSDISCGDSNFRNVPTLTAELYGNLRDACPAFRHYPCPDAPQPPYSEFYPKLRSSMEGTNNTWKCCPACVNRDARIKRMQYLSGTTHTYVANLVAADPIIAQLLSVLNIGMAVTQQHEERRRQSFALGKVIHDSLLNLVLLHHNPTTPGAPITVATLPRHVKYLYDQNLAKNPVIHQYCCLVDRPLQQPGCPQAPMSIVKHLVHRAQERAPVHQNASSSAHLHALVPDRLPVTFVPATAIFNMGTMEAVENQRTVPLVADCHGLPHIPTQVLAHPVS
jgi:hypothetical protein